MELLQLRYFITVAKMLNISQAAKHHMIPQPAMSQTISRLEKELGKPLFDRHKNRLKLTQEGQVFLDSVTASMSELDYAIHSVSGEGDVLRGELTILAQQHRATIVDCIVEFKKKYPDVSFRLYNIQDRNNPDDCDLCIGCTPPNEKYTDGKCLITENLRIMVSATHPLVKKGAVRFEELKDEEFVVLDKTGSLWQHTLHLCRQAGFEPKISMVYGDIYCMTKYVAAGMAITVCPEIAWRGIKNETMVYLPTIPQYTRPTYVFQNRLKSPSGLREVFFNFLVEYFATQL